MRSPLSAGPRRGERVYVSVCLFWTAGATDRVELFLQCSWQKKISLIRMCWKVDGSNKNPEGTNVRVTITLYSLERGYSKWHLATMINNNHSPKT